MGVLNATPDSFSGDGVLGQGAIDRGRVLLQAGADVLDVGGQSTRPGAEAITEQEEMDRVLPVVQALAGEVEVPLSVDTSSARVAQAALACGASIINDISAGTFDVAMLPQMAAADCGFVLMHLRERPQEMGWSERRRPDTAPLIAEIQEFWTERVAAARKAGVTPERLMLDPGFGFGKSLAENLDLLVHGRELTAGDLPVLLGPSRKSTIGRLVNGAAPEQRVWGTAASVTLAVAAGYAMVRVHDVEAMRDVVRVADAVCRGMD